MKTKNSQPTTVQQDTHQIGSISGVRAGDYLIHARDTRRTQLLIALTDESPEGTVTCLVDRTRFAEEPKDETINVTDILLNLGQQPRAGSVYGCNVQPQINEKADDVWGTIHYHVALDREQRKLLRRALTTVHRRMLELGVGAEQVFDSISRLFICPPKGKNQGMYHARKEGGDWITIRLAEEWDQKYVEDVLYHELAHGLDLRVLSQKTQARWVTLYTKIVTVGSHSMIDLQQLWTTVEGKESISQVLSELGEEETQQFDDCIRWINATFSLSRKQVNILMATEAFEHKYWPTHDLDNHQYDAPLGDYANKNPCEFFAEAFRQHMMGFVLPKSVATRLSKTLIEVKHGSVPSDDC